MVEQPKPGIFPVSGDVGQAPVVFFEAAPNIGNFGGVVAITLSTMLQTIDQNGDAQIEQHIVAHLRTNAAGARSLRSAIDGALLMLEPVEGQAN